MSKQTAANVIFISQISEKSCTYGITNFWFSLCDFPLMRVFTSPKMRISRGSFSFVLIFSHRSYKYHQLVSCHNNSYLPIALTFVFTKILISERIMRRPLCTVMRDRRRSWPIVVWKEHTHTIYLQRVHRRKMLIVSIKMMAIRKEQFPHNVSSHFS